MAHGHTTNEDDVPGPAHDATEDMLTLEGVSPTAGPEGCAALTRQEFRQQRTGHPRRAAIAAWYAVRAGARPAPPAALRPECAEFRRYAIAADSEFANRRIQLLQFSVIP